MLDVNSVQQMRSGDSFDWQWLALIAFGAFLLLSTLEQVRLRYELNTHGRNRRAIARLTPFVNEGNALKGGISVFFAGDSEDDEKRGRERERERLGVEWENRVRVFIERECPEFLAEWDTATSTSSRHECLMSIIKELRARL